MALAQTILAAYGQRAADRENERRYGLLNQQQQLAQSQFDFNKAQAKVSNRLAEDQAAREQARLLMLQEQWQEAQRNRVDFQTADAPNFTGGRGPLSATMDNTQSPTAFRVDPGQYAALMRLRQDEESAAATRGHNAWLRGRADMEDKRMTAMDDAMRELYLSILDENAGAPNYGGGLRTPQGGAVPDGLSYGLPKSFTSSPADNVADANARLEEYRGTLRDLMGRENVSVAQLMANPAFNMLLQERSTGLGLPEVISATGGDRGVKLFGDRARDIQSANSRLQGLTGGVNVNAIPAAQKADYLIGMFEQAAASQQEER